MQCGSLLDTKALTQYSGLLAPFQSVAIPSLPLQLIQPRVIEPVIKTWIFPADVFLEALCDMDKRGRSGYLKKIGQSPDAGVVFIAQTEGSACVRSH
jgi:hypothetical protein